MHTHQTWALALNMLKNNRLIPASQTAVSLCDRIAYDDNYAGGAVSLVEGERVADLISDHDVVFMKNHGVLVVGETVAQAYKRLYRLERACRTQVLAMTTQRELAPIPEEVIKQVKSPVPHDRFSPADRDRLYLDAMMRVLDRELPGYAS
jgi:ribulose-5-phosphate 4-epimerase/fuculose-1-phosphate aldolase